VNQIAWNLRIVEEPFISPYHIWSSIAADHYATRFLTNTVPPSVVWLVAGRLAMGFIASQHPW
jgi:hypothetical protein